MQLQYQSLNMFHLIDLQEPHTLWVHYYLHFMEIRASCLRSLSPISTPSPEPTIQALESSAWPSFRCPFFYGLCVGYIYVTLRVGVSEMVFQEESSI